MVYQWPQSTIALEKAQGCKIFYVKFCLPMVE